MGEEVAISRRKDEAGPELESMFSEFVLAVAGSFCAGPCFSVIPPKQMEQVTGFQFRSLIHDSICIDKQRERDTRLFAKQTSVIHVAEPDRRKRGPGLTELTLMLAQLRDVFATENSSVVPQEDNHRATLLPQRAQADFSASGFGQHNIRDLRTERLRHDHIVADRLGGKRITRKLAHFQLHG